jgi:phosphatidate phosphatase APP1
MPRSSKNGHFKTNLILPKAALNLPAQQNGVITLPFKAIDELRNFDGNIHCVPSTGVSIISDIDDTIKDTNYLNKKEFMRNTFLREFRAIPGMAKLFQKWRLEFENCCFHFVSASPYQLYEELDDFVRLSGFPSPATFHLKTVRPKDQSILQLFADPVDYKRKHIESLLKRFPSRKFHLVGDSGEKDPEIYAAIYKQYPDQIIGIWIRNINGANLDRLDGVPTSKWNFFGNGNDLMFD